MPEGVGCTGCSLSNSVPTVIYESDLNRCNFRSKSKRHVNHRFIPRSYSDRLGHKKEASTAFFFSAAKFSFQVQFYGDCACFIRQMHNLQELCTVGFPPFFSDSSLPTC